jgi:imidazolonepropionase-like amidohydrolase
MIVALVLFTASLPTASARAAAIALVGGTVHPVSGPTLSGGTVLIRDGKIEAVGTGVNVPGDATVVNCEGKHVWPGMVSAMTMLGLTELESVRGTQDNTEVGTVNPNVRAEVEVNPESELLQVTRVNGVTTALTVPRGAAINGTSALIHLDGWTFEDMTLKAPVGLHVSWPNMTPVRGFRENRSDEEQKKARDAAVDAIRKAFDDARAYEKALAAEGSAGIPRHDRDVKWDAMRRAVRGELPVYFHASSLNQIKAVLAFVDEQNLKHVVLVGGYDADRVADELKARDIAVICEPTLQVPRRRWESYDAAYTLPARLAAAGLRWCLSDGGAGFTAMNARNLPYHASMAAAFGLSRDEALKGVTLYPAQIFGVADKIGSIEPGKIADLSITNGDLLDESTVVEQVYIAGKPISMENRQTRLFHKYDARPRGPKARPR